jgi:hypothetical protein
VTEASLSRKSLGSSDVDHSGRVENGLLRIETTLSHNHTTHLWIEFSLDAECLNLAVTHSNCHFSFVTEHILRVFSALIQNQLQSATRFMRAVFLTEPL